MVETKHDPQTQTTAATLITNAAVPIIGRPNEMHSFA
jgi:hypothetical protein